MSPWWIAGGCVAVIVIIAIAEGTYLARLSLHYPEPRVGDLIAYARPRRLTPDGARELGLMVNYVPTPWAETGGTHALAPTPNAPCQDCWHRRDAHAEFEPMRCSGDGDEACDCDGWDPFLAPEMPHRV